MARELPYLDEACYKIYSDTRVVRFDYCDDFPRIKKVYKNTKGYYIKGQAYWEPASIYLRNYEARLEEYKKNHTLQDR